MMSRRFRWFLRPATGLRRWAGLALLGFILFFLGFALSFKLLLLPLFDNLADLWRGLIASIVPSGMQEEASHLMGLLLLLFGGYFGFIGTRGALRSLVEAINPGMKSGITNVYLRKQQLARGPQIVALGGGTGLSTLLRGLKQHSSNITAIVTVTDDGGSSGRLVQEMGIIPPGDIRNCLVALADAEKRMTDLFQHRFQEGSGSLSGHSIGNLLLAAFVDQAGGDYDQALTLASEVLAIRGRVLPSTLNTVRLRALMENGLEICGETKIASSRLKIRRVFLDPSDPIPHEAALEAIHGAELICIGPGSVYTSVIPNLLVPGIADAIHESSAIKAYICNVMTQPGESDAFTAAEHLVALQANAPARVCDYVVLNTEMPSQSSIEKYNLVGQYYVEPDLDRIKAMGFKPVTGNFMNEADYVRHDPLRLATKIVDLIYK